MRSFWDSGGAHPPILPRLEGGADHLAATKRKTHLPNDMVYKQFKDCLLNPKSYVALDHATNQLLPRGRYYQNTPGHSVSIRLLTTDLHSSRIRRRSHLVPLSVHLKGRDPSTGGAPRARSMSSFDVRGMTSGLPPASSSGSSSMHRSPPEWSPTGHCRRVRRLAVPAEPCVGPSNQKIGRNSKGQVLGLTKWKVLNSWSSFPDLKELYIYRELLESQLQPGSPCFPSESWHPEDPFPFAKSRLSEKGELADVMVVGAIH